MLYDFTSNPRLFRTDAGSYVIHFSTYRDDHPVLHTLLLGDSSDASVFFSSLNADYSRFSELKDPLFVK